MKPASCVQILSANGSPFAVHLGANFWSEHAYEPTGLAWSLKTRQGAHGALVASPDAMKQMLRFCEMEFKGSLIAAFGMDRLGQYRKSETWLKARIKYTMPVSWMDRLRLRGRKAEEAPKLNALYGSWSEDEFLLMAAGEDRVAVLRVLAEQLMTGPLALTRKLIGIGAEGSCDGLILFRQDLVPEGWSARMEETQVFKRSLKEWQEKYGQRGAGASAGVSAGRAN